eukprot:snap_masked-scaffold154_size301342-processed-gene-2.15 protein:Tk07774 transcript:snap_masked-scaffold154_size301342-processed-gene-2.15-mRNA-1 annotation:"GJ15814"
MNSSRVSCCLLIVCLLVLASVEAQRPRRRKVVRVRRPASGRAINQARPVDQQVQGEPKSSGCPEQEGLQLYEDPENCHRFFKCANGTLTHEECENGLLFDERTAQTGSVHNHCNYNWAVECGERYLDDTPISSLGCPYEFGIYRNDKCKPFYNKCAFGQYVKTYCETGLVFDETIHTCNWPDQVHEEDGGCDSEALLGGFRCPGPEDLSELNQRFYPFPRFAIEEQPNLYLTCVNDQPRLQSCGPGSQFDPDVLGSSMVSERRQLDPLALFLALSSSLNNTLDFLSSSENVSYDIPPFLMDPRHFPANGTQLEAFFLSILNFNGTAYQDVLEDLQESFHCGQGSATFEQLIRYVDISWWLDGVFQLAIGALGVLINILALPILFSKRMKSVFNCLLTILLVMETLFILATCYETFRQNLHFNSQLSNAIFAFIIYPAKTAILYYSIYMATVMARERYMAVRCPVKYHNDNSGLNPWRRAVTLGLPVVLFSSIFIIPVFFEASLETKLVKLQEHEAAHFNSQLELDSDPDMSYDAVDNSPLKIDHNYSLFWLSLFPPEPRFTNVTIHELTPSGLRFNQHYVLLYKSLANFLLTMILPFSLLVFYNWRIISVLRRRRRLTNRPLQAQNSRSVQLKAEEARKSYVLFAITFMFIVCHSVRFILGIHECLSVQEYQEGVRNHCNPSPLWVLILQSVSNLLLTLNSSLCSILYCLTSRDFQNELKTHYAWFKEQVSPSVEEQPPLPPLVDSDNNEVIIPMGTLLTRSQSRTLTSSINFTRSSMSDTLTRSFDQMSESSKATVETFALMSKSQTVIIERELNLISPTLPLYRDLVFGTESGEERIINWPLRGDRINEQGFLSGGIRINYAPRMDFRFFMDEDANADPGGWEPTLKVSQGIRLRKNYTDETMCRPGVRPLSSGKLIGFAKSCAFPQNSIADQSNTLFALPIGDKFCREAGYDGMVDDLSRTDLFDMLDLMDYLPLIISPPYYHAKVFFKSSGTGLFWCNGECELFFKYPHIGRAAQAPIDMYHSPPETLYKLELVQIGAIDYILEGKSQTSGQFNVSLRMPQIPALKRGSIHFQAFCLADPVALGPNATSRDNTCDIGIDLMNSYDLQPARELATFSGEVISNSSWTRKILPFPAQTQGGHIQLKGMVHGQDGTIGLDDFRLTTSQYCIPRWIKVPNMKMNLEKVAEIQEPWDGFEFTSADQETLDKKHSLFRSRGNFDLESCARLCWLGTACDMFEHDSLRGVCRLAPHTGYKGVYWSKFTEEDKVFDGTAIFILECSEALETAVAPNMEMAEYPWLKASIETTGFLDQGKVIYDDLISPTVMSPGAQEALRLMSNGTSTLSLHLPVTLPKLDPSYWTSAPSLVGVFILELRISSTIEPLVFELHHGAAVLDSFQVFNTDQLQRFTSIIPNMASANDTTLTLILTTTVANNETVVDISNLDLITDVPIYVGCFVHPETTPFKTFEDNLDHGTCLATCQAMDPALRYAALRNGTDCACLASLMALKGRPDDNCNVVCSGNPDEICGSQNLSSVWIGACPVGMVRFEEQCYFQALPSPNTIEANEDECADKDSNLMWPDSDLAIRFLRNHFGTTNPYHVGYRKFRKWEGVLHSDHSRGVAIPYISAMNGRWIDLPDITTNLMTKHSCFLLDWSNLSQPLIHASPCPVALGICMTKLGGFTLIVTFQVFEGDPASLSPVVSRLVNLPDPIETRRLRLTFLESAPEVNLKLDLIGMLSQDRYDLNPFLDHIDYSEDQTNHYITNNNSWIVTDRTISLGGSVLFRGILGNKASFKRTESRTNQTVAVFILRDTKGNPLKMEFKVNHLTSRLFLILTNEIGSYKREVLMGPFRNNPTFLSSLEVFVRCQSNGYRVFVNGDPVGLYKDVIVNGIIPQIAYIQWYLKQYYGNTTRIALTEVKASGFGNNFGRKHFTTQITDENPRSLFTFASDVPLKEESGLLQISEREMKPKQFDIGYIPFAIHQHCYHGVAGNVRCFPNFGRHSQEGRIQSGFGGGPWGQGKLKCPYGYRYLGTDCIRFPIRYPVSHFEARMTCRKEGNMVFFPKDRIAVVLLRESLKHLVAAPASYNLTDALDQRHSSISIADEICRREGTRLAGPRNQEELTRLHEFMRSTTQWMGPNPGHTTLWTGYRGTENQVVMRANSYAPIKPWLLSNGRTMYDMNVTAFGPYCYQMAFKARVGLEHTLCTVERPGLVDETEPEVLALCQSEECKSIDEEYCIFPFNTGTDANGHHLEGYDKACERTCNVNDCPLGFYRNYPDRTCYQVSSNNPDDAAVETFDQAQAICNGQGARLWEPRTNHGVLMLSTTDLDSGHFDWSNDAFTALGLKMVFKGGTWSMNYRSDDVSVSQTIIDRLPWAPGYPLVDPIKTCVALKKQMLQNVACSGFVSSKLLGHICEAKPMTTQAGFSSCVFPFDYHDGTSVKTSEACSHDYHIVGMKD